jgi:hypothetical protein
VARFTALFKRAFLRRLWESTDDSTTLKADLIAASVGQVSNLEAGYLIQSVSQAGHATSFSVPPGAALTPQTLAELCEDLLQRYDESAADLDSSDQAAIYADMLNNLRPIRRIRSDFYLFGYADR